MDFCKATLTTTVIACLLLSVQCLKFEEESASSSNQKIANISAENPQVPIEGRQSARHLFDFVGLGTGPQIDPFLRKTNEKCLNGELSECFKSQALNTFDDFFRRDVYV
jgi:hypothetical protein